LRMSFSNWGLIRRLILSRYSKDSPTSAIWEPRVEAHFMRGRVPWRDFPSGFGLPW
jgi:hypothetical protein